MPRIKLTLEYDGTDYVGWQVQPNGLSVQEALETGLKELLGSRTEVVGAARTDAGVHALGQVACFDTARDLPMKAYWMGLTHLLPRDLSVVKAEVVEPGFDPRRASQGKRYRYSLSNRRTHAPLRRRTHWEIYQPLDLAAMEGAAPALLGRHDFSAFRAADCQAQHAVRELRTVQILRTGEDELSVWVEGTAFLKYMVRNLVGSLVEVGKGRQHPSWLASVLASRDRGLAGPTAPPHGLTLVEVLYGPGSPLAAEVDDGG